MGVNVEVGKSSNENNLSLIRKFTKKVQGSGVLSRLRGRRYSARTLSEYVKKKKALKRIRRHVQVQEAIKMGKMSQKM